MTKMTDKQRIFVSEYLKDRNATRSALKAGYSKKTAHMQGCKLLKLPKIKDILNKNLAEILDKNKVTAERVIAELARIGFSDPKKFFDSDGGIKSMDALKIEHRAAVSGIEVTTTTDQNGKETVKKKVKLWDKVKALELLAKNLGILVDRSSVDITGNVISGESLTPEQWEKKYSGK